MFEKTNQHLKSLPFDQSVLWKMASSFIEDPKELGERCTPMAHFFFCWLQAILNPYCVFFI